jgi:indolepyruvate ferredoxin oxidoreductase, beta subunit
VLVNDYTISPLSVSSGSDTYPDDERVKAIIRAVTPHFFLLPATALAESLGNDRVNNVVLLGALSHLIPDVPTALWVEAIRERVPPKFADLNERAFVLGRETIQGM